MKKDRHGSFVNVNVREGKPPVTNANLLIQFVILVSDDKFSPTISVVVAKVARWIPDFHSSHRT